MQRNSLKKPTCIDLFCGAGGLSDGLRQAGFEPLYGVDFDANAIKTFQRNHPYATAACKDIGKVTAAEILHACRGRELDLLAGGPSCQGYSTHGKRIEDDPRNFLFKHFIRLAKELAPRWLLMENVRGLLTYRGGYFRELIVNSLTKIGYRVKAEVLCAADYGVPQLRYRIFFIGTRTDAEVSFPEPTHADEETLLTANLLPYVTVQEAIGDLPLMRGQLKSHHWDYLGPPSSGHQRYSRQYNPNLTLHQANGVSDQAQQVVEFIKEGQGLRAVPVQHLPDRFKRMRKISNGKLRQDCTTLYYRLDRERPAYTITCYFRNVASGPFLHPLEDRSLSYREAARLMSFQDRYRFCESGLARQMGNAVPPLLAKAIGKHILTLDQSCEGAQIETAAMH